MRISLSFENENKFTFLGAFFPSLSLSLTLPAPLRLPLRLRFVCCFVVWCLEETFLLDMYLFYEV